MVRPHQTLPDPVVQMVVYYAMPRKWVTPEPGNHIIEPIQYGSCFPEGTIRFIITLESPDLTPIAKEIKG